MALHKTSHAKGVIPVPVAVACEVVAHRASFKVSAALALNDIIHMTNLPAGHVPVDIIVEKSLYWDVNGVWWAAGVSAPGTLITPLVSYSTVR